jgi:hypothetical protein
MGLRFSRRFRIVPGLRLNLSRSGVSASVGRRGAWFTVGPRGTRETIGIPGTGISYSEQQPVTNATSTEPSAGEMVFWILAVVVVVAIVVGALDLFY